MPKLEVESWPTGATLFSYAAVVKEDGRRNSATVKVGETRELAENKAKAAYRGLIENERKAKEGTQIAEFSLED